ncbi:hypothetical protein DJ568_15610 [Mucilaginibacter hurinus]|uniref:Alpha/beta hydrolase n=1 Tax=Mucilaginibacter hurinus TaxID=2201324 RepID=A0A367GLQ9_9SPHI|nr:alpha/beta hydrolase [Mucilaginibacter hurinus]RCH53965.1 hypothetical protein DJ568_15610 [Mucilaginibacter hurinus]
MGTKKQVLFIQGGGDDGYTADAKMVSAFEKALGSDYEVHYPRLESDDTAPDFGWPSQIGRKIDELKEGAILIAHSVGASLLLKYLSENSISKKISGIFLIATPFWSGDEEWKQGLKLSEDFPQHLPQDIPLFFYHCQDDEEVPFKQLTAYREKHPTATYRKVSKGGHQLENNLDVIIRDIKER